MREPKSSSQHPQDVSPAPGAELVPTPDRAIVFYGQAEPKNLPEPVRKAIAGLKVREIPGIAETWTPSGPGDFVAGIMVQYRERVSQYETDVIVLETPNGFRSVWLGVDLKNKITSTSIGRPMVISYEGMITRPRAKGPIKNFRVLEVLMPEEPQEPRR
jgi:hypothetical protein